MDKKDTEGTDKVPYQKGLVTTSLVILVYVFGQGEISQKLSVTVIGLTLHNPAVLEYAMGAVLAWYLWRFMTNNRFAFCAELTVLGGDLIRKHGHDLDKIREILEVPDSIRGGGYYGDVVSLVAVRNLLDWRFEKATQDAKTGEIKNSPIAIKSTALLRWKLKVVWLWFLTYPSFPDRYIPLLLGLSAAAAGGMHLIGMR